MGSPALSGYCPPCRQASTLPSYKYMHISSRQQSPRRSSAHSSPGAEATNTRQIQERVCPDVSALSSSPLSSIDGQSAFCWCSIPVFKTARMLDNVLRLTSPHRHHGRHHKSPLRDSPQNNCADPGPLVWVRVTRSGKLAPREPGGSEGSYWWPACVR